jgi:hypothetical protein
MNEIVNLKSTKNLPPNKLFYLSRCKNSNRNNLKRLKTITYSRLKLQKTTCHLQQHFFNICEPNKGTKGPKNHSLD